MLNTRLRISDVVDPQGSLSWQESLALVQSLAAAKGGPGPAERPEAGGPIVNDFVLHPDGTVTPAATAQRPVSLSELALLLDGLLRTEGSSANDDRPPAGVKFTIARALGLVEAPPIPTVRQFTAALQRFERQDRRTLLAALFERHAARQRAVPADRRDHAPSADSFRRLLREADERAWEASRAAADRIDDRVSATRVDALRRFLREADERNYLLTAQLRERAPVAPGAPGGAPTRAAGLAAPAGYAIRRRQLKRGLSVLALVAAAAVAEQHEVVGRRPSHSPPPAATSRNRPRVPVALGATPAAAPVSVKSPVAPPNKGALRNQAERDAPSKERQAAAARNAASEPAELPGQMVQALDVNRKPVFSPSFSADGSAVFFDTNDGTTSAVMAAQPVGTGGRSRSELRVVSLVDDGARNYHPRLSPDNRTLAFDSDRDGERGVYLADRDGRHVRRVSGAGYAAVPTWSPDGRQLAFVKAEPDRPKVWNVWILNVAYGTARRVTDYGYGQPWGASWFPDGHRICYAHEDALVVLDLGTGRSTAYGSPKPGRLVRTPAVSPNGHFVVFQLYRDGAWLLDLRDASMRRILADPSAEEFAWTPDGRQVAFHSKRSGEWGVWFMAPEP